MTPAMRRALHVTALLGIFLAACTEPRVALNAGAREYTAQDYPEVLRRWSRTGQLLALAELDDLLTVTSTFESWDFRWAYVVRYAQDYRLSVEQRRELLDRTLAETKDGHRFYVALYGAASRRQTDLSKPTSAWIVRLIDDQGGETAPTSIDPILKPGSLELTYFPYSTPWRQLFRIRFPRTGADGKPTISENARWFGLRFAGAEGARELRWDVEGAAPN